MRLELGQVKKMCIFVSFSLHLGQLVADIIPRFCRFSPMGSALLIIDQRKSRSFGEHELLHTSFNHLKSSHVLTDGIWAFLAAEK